MIKSDNLVWFDGKFIPTKKATVPITTHALHYGTSGFEGIRGYWDDNNLYIFRLDDHIKRFKKTMSYYNITPKYSQKIIKDSIVKLCKKNKIQHSCYIRPLCFVGNHGIKLHITQKTPSHIIILTFVFDDLFDKRGIKLGISSWRKFSNKSTPIQAKMGGNYLNSIIATGEAKAQGFDEALLLDIDGNVSEAPGENIIIVKNKKLVTPKITYALDGITKKTVFEISKILGFNIKSNTITKRQLYAADEVFITGTASEIIPVIKIDDKKIGNGKIGTITNKIMVEYSNIVFNRNKKYSSWLTKVY